MNIEYAGFPGWVGVKLSTDQCPKTHEEEEDMSHVPYVSAVFYGFCLWFSMAKFFFCLGKRVMCLGKRVTGLEKRVTYLGGFSAHGFCRWFSISG
jgi:hypothetical protein